MTKELPAGSMLSHYRILSKIVEGGVVSRILSELDTPQLTVCATHEKLPHM